MLLGFKCAINPQNLIKINGAIFEKIKFKIFFSCKLALILMVGQKKKKARQICKGTLESILIENGQLVWALR